jgi:hypothetical protein
MSAGPLRRTLKQVAREERCPLKDLTVLASKNDPFRVDTPAGHRDGQWLADVVRELIGDKRIHLRGVHYAISMHSSPIFKPNGEPSSTALVSGPFWPCGCRGVGPPSLPVPPRRVARGLHAATRLAGRPRSAAREVQLAALTTRASWTRWASCSPKPRRGGPAHDELD